MRMTRAWIKKAAVGAVSRKIRRKTKLSELQSTELAGCLMNNLYTFHGWRFWRYRVFLRLMLHQINWKEFRLTEKQFDHELREKTHRQNYREPLGLWFTIDSEETYAHAPQIQNTDNITYYASGREPILAVANQISGERKVVLLPYFTCWTVYQPFLENGWQIVNYKVSRDLKMDLQDVKAAAQKHQPTMAVFMEYSGMDLTDEELEVVRQLKAAGCVTVVDRTQNIYSESRSEAVDFYCGSLRKWFCCPDGGYLERNGERPLPPAPPAEVYNDVYATACAAMMFANGLARKRKIPQYLKIGEFFRRLAATYVCGQPVRERNMSAYSKAVYLQERKKDGAYIQRRKENFAYLFHRITELTTIYPVSTDFSRFSSATLYFHIYAENRDQLSRYLRSKGIITLINWVKPKCLGELDEESEYIFRHILSLPCDQRYTQTDMQRLCDALEAYDSEQKKTVGAM